jgi:hypothetical protein
MNFIARVLIGLPFAMSGVTKDVRKSGTHHQER